MSYLPVGSCCSNEQMEYYGRTGTGPTGGVYDTLAFGKALNDPAKKAIYDKAKAAGAKIASAKSQTELIKAQKEAVDLQQQVASGTIGGASTTTWLVIGGGLAALAGFLVLRKKKAS